MKQDTVLAFIKRFKSTQDVFLYGMCYWFAYILEGRFGGTMMYDQIEDHFMQEIDGRLYDVSGDVTEKYRESSSLKRWEDVPAYDASLYQRVLRDCVYKIERGW